jgi:hypothetical protein
VEAIVVFAFGKEFEEFKEMMMKFFLWDVNQPEAFDTGSVYQESSERQLMHFGECCGVLAFVA